MASSSSAEPSEWSQASFTTVPSMIAVTAPNGGEQWQRGLEYFIQWNDNLAEDTTIELHRGGVLLRNIATGPSTGAYKWKVDLDLEPGSDYSIKVKSSTNATPSDTSNAAFTILE